MPGKAKSKRWKESSFFSPVFDANTYSPPESLHEKDSAEAALLAQGNGTYASTVVLRFGVFFSMLLLQ